MNYVIYPFDNLNIDFTKKNHAVLYIMYILYYGKEESNPILSSVDFVTQAPIVLIDNSKQNDAGTASTVDVSIEIEA